MRTKDKISILVSQIADGERVSIRRAIFSKQARSRKIGVVLFLITSLYAIALALIHLLKPIPTEVVVPSLVLGTMLVLLTLSDIKYYILPDTLTLPLLALGVVGAGMYGHSTAGWHLVASVGGAAFICLAKVIYRQFRGREGIGLGDAKLLAAAGAWVGPQGVPSVLLYACVLGLLVVILLAMAGRDMSHTSRLPFGAYLSFGTWVVWLGGPLQ